VVSPVHYSMRERKEAVRGGRGEFTVVVESSGRRCHPKRLQPTVSATSRREALPAFEWRERGHTHAAVLCAGIACTLQPARARAGEPFCAPVTCAHTCRGRSSRARV